MSNGWIQVNRQQWVSLALAAVGLVAALRGAAWAGALASDGSSRPPTPTVTKAPSAPATVGKRAHQGFFLRLSVGAVYLHESWRPDGGGLGAVYGGGGTSLEAAIGKSVRPGLIVGGLWQLVVVTDPNESYGGTTYVVAATDRFLDEVAGFVAYYPNPRRGFHLGGSAGLVAASNLDRAYGNYTTSWGPALSVRCGYEAFFSSRWSVGALARLEGYRYSTTEASVSSVSYGLLPTLALALTFN
jgi:hypothetical protein